MYGDARTTNMALTRSITTCMPLQHRRGMMALFNLLITVTHCKKIKHCFIFCCFLIDYGIRHNQFITQSRNIFGGTSKSILYHAVKTVHSIHVRQKFEDYQAFVTAIECYQSAESVQFYKRDSRTVQKAEPRVQKKRKKKMAEPLIEPATSCSQVRYNTD